MANLKAREEQFYKKFGANNYKEFRERVLSLFVDNEDVEVLKRFLPDNLSSKL